MNEAERLLNLKKLYRYNHVLFFFKLSEIDFYSNTVHLKKQVASKGQIFVGFFPFFFFLPISKTQGPN